MSQTPHDFKLSSEKPRVISTENSEAKRQQGKLRYTKRQQELKVVCAKPRLTGAKG